MIQYGYSDRSELTSAISFLDGNSGGSFVVGSADDTEVYGRSFQYSYDNQGNRAITDGTKVNDRDSNYTTNALNQYTLRDIPGYIDIGVKAADTATVTVTDETPSPDVDYSTSQQGEFFYAELDNDGATGGYVNSSGGLLRAISISDGTTLVEGKEYLKEDDEDFTYWDDGMLKWDGLWFHQYDAENRPTWVAMGNVAGDEPNPRVGLTFRYDYLGRRVLKMVYHWNGTAWAWQSNRKYVYDGFNLIAETDWSGNIKRTYVWGLDESGSLQGAGGVGGLLMIRDEATAKEYFVMNDGKGNVNGILNAETGSLVAAYEYGPFGEPLRASGTFADDNNFRFSSKFTDPESGLVNFGLRHYNPSMGRFISRDPIGEAGGLNLYGFVGNDPVNRWDYLGLTGSPPVYIDGIHYEFYPDGSVYRYVYRPDGSGADMERVWTYAGTNQSPYSWGVIGEPGISNFDDLEEAANGSSEQTQEQTQKEEWKPNKEDCADLFSEWGSRYFAKPGDRFTEKWDAAIAGLFQLARRSDFGSLESGFGTYRGSHTVGGFLGFFGEKKPYFSFTKITTGSEGGWDPIGRNYSSYNPEFVAHWRAGTLVDWGHSHPSDPNRPDRFSWYPTTTAHTGEVIMTGDGTARFGTAAFMIGDELSMRMIFPSNYDNSFSSWDIASGQQARFNPVGTNIPGAPSSDVVSKLKSCEAAGFGQ